MFSLRWGGLRGRGHNSGDPWQAAMAGRRWIRCLDRQNGSGAMIYLFHGPDDFSLREAVQKLLAQALPADTADLNTMRLAAGEVTLDALRFACESMPFLAERRAVIVEGLLARLTSRRPRETKRETARASRDADLTSQIAAYLPVVPETAVLVLIEVAAPPATGPLAKAIAASRVKQQAFALLSGATLVRWIKDRARTYGGTISDQAAALLASYTGGDLRGLSNEVQKLVTYAGPGKTVQETDVQLLASRGGEENIFALVDAIGAGNRGAALRALSSLMEHGERPERILVMVGRQVRLLLQARDAQARRLPAEETARVLGLAPYPQRKVMDQAHVFELSRLAAMHQRVLAADVAIKTGLQEAALALELLLVELCATSPRPVRPAPSRGSRYAGG